MIDEIQLLEDILVKYWEDRISIKYYESGIEILFEWKSKGNILYIPHEVVAWDQNQEM